MAKSKSRYVCTQCGSDFPQMYGRCPDCSSWGSILEQSVEAIAPGNPNLLASRLTQRQTKGAAAPATPMQSLTLTQIDDSHQTRLPSGYEELDRVLGGGIVPGSLVLIGGEPGIGKSTLLLGAAQRLMRKYPTLYVCAEESAQQVKLRSQRLGLHERDAQNLYLMPETDLETIVYELQSLRPPVAVIDSIQALYFASLNAAPGSVSQVRECTSVLMRVAKRENITLLIVGHVTKEGAIAGPKVLEHLVDTVLYFEGDRFATHRLLRSVKNRFGATQEIGIFEMAESGLIEVSNPSELFLGNREEPAPGTATIVACEGTRPLVVELQALVSPTSYSSPRRTTTGLETNRFLQILAVLEKRIGIPLSKLDAYLASAGGINVAEPAVDLGVAIAVAASFRDRIVDPRTVLIGEVGLGGQVRPVSQLDLRLKEAAKLGFKRAIIPNIQVTQDYGLELVPVGKVMDAIIAALPRTVTSSSDDPND
ncbi:DNA repair protein RadA [Pseudanabaena sp. PCC 6802]|uniref:DNA repair protein RadA n=1 Tax=Pseudanabaena sp. PCC 6802 TaxID=118173 RepID=UPI0004763EB5|nr:DNA repair protein RadA [Pseudanabaena sp. PCC 6802]